ncbi:unnamed protein product [Rotaria sp. Silwood1]|nr:unnamed protein product [Rotaria sp. Silwood1]
MTTIDTRNFQDTIELISIYGVQKTKQRIDHMIIKGFFAGVLLSFGGLLLLIVGGGSTPMIQNFGPSIHKLLQGIVFPIGLVLIVITGADLFTGLLSNDPYRLFTIQLAETKGNIKWYEIFLRGIGGNWLVCLSLWLASSARELYSKILGIYLPICVFIVVGYEHSIANMFTVQMGMILGANLSIGKYILHVLIPVTLGNIIGGGIFVGFAYWYLSLPKKFNTDVKNDGITSTRDVYQIVKQHDDLNLSQQA